MGNVPPELFFLVSAVFHYLGPSLAVLMFARVDVLGVAWLRVASVAVVFGVWRGPRRLARMVRALSPGARWTLAALGAVLAVMNSAFYLAVDRLPLSTVGAIEFCGTVILAAAGARTRATFSLLLALLPVFATVIGAIVLRQVPTVQDAVGIMLVVLGVALHQQERN
jgi:inner membrane transporter RhtA